MIERVPHRASSWPMASRLLPPATWTGRRAASSFRPERYAYPGARPDGSYAVADGSVWGLDPSDGGWVDRDTREAIDLEGRQLVLAYGSNGDPEKLSERLDGVVYALCCLVLHHAAVWCDARRTRDASPVATLHPDPGQVEVHHVLAVTAAQLDVIDRWEGSPRYYERRDLTGSVVLETGSVPSDVLAYIGTDARRPPLLIAGAIQRLIDVPIQVIDSLVPALL